MTWNEFMGLIQRMLMEQGIDGTAKIQYIDISFPSEGTIELENEREPDGSVYIRVTG